MELFPEDVGPSHQHNPVAQVRDITQVSGQVQGIKFRYRGGNHAHDDSAASPLDEGVHSEARQARKPVRNIAGSLLAQRIDGLLVVADQVGGDAARVVGRERGKAIHLYRHELPINFHLRRSSRRKDQVADLLRGA